MLAQLPENKNKSIIIFFRLLPRPACDNYSTLGVIKSFMYYPFHPKDLNLTEHNENAGPATGK